MPNFASYSAVEDFSSRRIPFTVPANSTKMNQSVIISLIDDDVLEPTKEGFRLVLVVDESRTPTTNVRISTGRQLALFGIDDRRDS